MDLLNGVDIVQLGTTGLIAFGAVSVISMFNEDLQPKTKLALHFAFFLAFSFVPVALANEIAQKLRDAVAGTLMVVGAYQGGKKVGSERSF